MRRIMYGVKNGSVKILLYTMVFQPESPDILAKIKSAELAWYQRLEVILHSSFCSDDYSLLIYEAMKASEY